jgi:hypothetical protein
MSCKLKNAQKMLKDKGMSDEEIYNTLKDADNFKDEMKSGIESSGVPSEMIKISLESSDTSMRKMVIETLRTSSTMGVGSGGNAIEFTVIADIAGKAGFKPTSYEGIKYVMDKMKEDDPSGWEKVISTYAKMGYGGVGAEAIWKYIDNTYTARETALSAMSEVNHDSKIVIGQILQGKEVNGVEAQITVKEFYDKTKQETGFDIEKLERDAKEAGLSPLYSMVDEKTPEYIGVFAASAHPNALNAVKELLNEFKSGENIYFIETIDEMGKHGVSAKYGAETPINAVMTTEMQSIYSMFYDDISNDHIKDDSIKVDSTYGTLTWTDGIGNEHKRDAISGDAAYNPATGKYDIQTTINTDKYTKWTLTPALYGQAIKEFRTGKTEDGKEITKELWEKEVVEGFKTNGLWACSGSGCTTAETKGSDGSGGGSGGPGKSSSYTSTKDTSDKILLIRCNVDTATIINKTTGQEIGKVNTEITMKQGTYSIQVIADDYETYEDIIEISSYPVSKTVTLQKLPPSISQFINGIGGIQNLTWPKYLYMFCMYKEKVTGNYTWRTVAKKHELVDDTIIPMYLTNYDILYLYHMIKGEKDEADRLVADGRVILRKTSPAKIANATGTIGGGL